MVKSFWNIILWDYHNNSSMEAGKMFSFLLLSPVIKVLRNWGVNWHSQNHAISEGMMWGSDMSLWIFSTEFPSITHPLSPWSHISVFLTGLHQWCLDFTWPRHTHDQDLYLECFLSFTIDQGLSEWRADWVVLHLHWLYNAITIRT